MAISPRGMPPLPCACAELRRAARAVTKLYNQELRPTGLELTQFTLLMALELSGEIQQGMLGRALALDTTSLTRMLKLPEQRGWIRATAGDDRREKLLRLTSPGRTKLDQSRPYWERAQKRLRKALGEPSWSQVGGLLVGLAAAARTA